MIIELSAVKRIFGYLRRLSDIFGHFRPCDESSASMKNREEQAFHFSQKQPSNKDAQKEVFVCNILASKCSLVRPTVCKEKITIWHDCVTHFLTGSLPGSFRVGEKIWYLRYREHSKEITNFRTKTFFLEKKAAVYIIKYGATRQLKTAVFYFTCTLFPLKGWIINHAKCGKILTQRASWGLKQ